MDNYKLHLIVCVHLFLGVPSCNGLELLSSNDTSISEAAREKTQEIVFNNTIMSSNSSTTKKRHVVTTNDSSKYKNLQQMTTVSMEERQDVPANTLDEAGLIDIPAGSVTKSVSGLSTSQILGKLADVESCRHKCGQKQKLPCSCDLKCLVYKNCCEDMLTECPEVVTETRIRYGHLINAKVECAWDDFFLITECGTREPLEDFRTNLSGSLTHSINLTKSTSFRGVEPLSLNTASSMGDSLSTHAARSMGETLRFSDPRIQAIINVMNDAYVTDTATGFTYQNMNIFSCNARENSVPILWNTKYFDQNQFINYTTLGSIAQAIEDGSSIPPNIETVKSPGAECEAMAMISCDDQTKGYLAQKCEAFLSYVHLPDLNTVRIYGNKYCALCDLGPESPYAQYITAFTQSVWRRTFFRPPGFIVTLSEQSVTIDTFGEALHPWKTVNCKLPHTNLTEPITGDIPCAVVKCNDYGVLRQEGVCKYSYFTTMAVADDTFPLTRNEYEMFPKFARCFLELHNNVDFDGDFTPTVALFERRRNMVIYATDLFYYEIGGHMSKSQSDIIHHVMLMAKAFKLYRSTTPRTPHTFNIKHSIFSLATFNEMNSDNSKKYHANNNPNNVTVCFCTEFNPYTPRLIRLPCFISCIQDNFDVRAVSGYIESPCFSVFNVSNGRASHVEFNMAYIFALVLISTFFELKINIFIMT